MFDGHPYRSELIDRIEVIRRVLNATHTQTPTSQSDRADISREVRGLAIVLLFASYEHLLTSLCRGLLEIALAIRVGNRKLRKGFRLFSVHQQLQATNGASDGKIWREIGPKLLDCAFNARECTINPNLFPADGSYMKSSQVKLFCEIFELGDPGPILQEVWSRLDTIVTERNGIAHGRVTPEEVGRNYSFADIQMLVNLWECRWIAFIEYVELKANNRGFFCDE